MTLAHNNSMENLQSKLPLLHASGTMNWGLEQAVLEFIESLVTKSSVTIETGAGMSTLLLAAKCCNHFCITPSDSEIELIRAYCQEHSIDVGNVRFCKGLSQDVLPQLDLPSIDLVIIDGGHGIPIPFVDWCYLAPRLKVGGVLILDDVQIWTGAVLRDFLKAEWQWELIREFEKAVAFRKISDSVITDWGQQPFVVAQSELPNDWKWLTNKLHGHLSGIVTAIMTIGAQGAANKDTASELQHIKAELLCCADQIEALCTKKTTPV